MSKLVIVKLRIKEKPAIVTALVEEQKITELHIFPEETHEILGNIYVGKVQNIVPNINAAFIEIADKTVCYYSLSSKINPIYTMPKKDKTMKAGDELLVQVNKERMKTKAPCVTSNLNFTGKYVVLTTENRRLGMSGKLSAEDKSKLKKWLEPMMDDTFGAIIRTNAKDAAKKDILCEMEQLKKQLNKVAEIGRTRTCFSLIHETEPGYILTLRDAYSDKLEEIITDDEGLHRIVSTYLQEYQPDDWEKLRFYQDMLLPLSKLYSIESTLLNTNKEKIWLQSGGSIVIQQTEAFVAIDVNTGKFVGKKKVQETFRKINLEAAKEIAYQLRLRNLSGIILIDFINLEHKDHQDELMHVLQKYLRKDSVKGLVVDMTKLNIVEVTRQKVRKSLAEELGGIEYDSIRSL